MPTDAENLQTVKSLLSRLSRGRSPTPTEPESQALEPPNDPLPRELTRQPAFNASAAAPDWPDELKSNLVAICLTYRDARQRVIESTYRQCREMLALSERASQQIQMQVSLSLCSI